MVRLSIRIRSNEDENRGAPMTCDLQRAGIVIPS